MAEQVATFKVEDARLIFKNFSGKEGPYNRAGQRSFCVVLDPDVAAQMAEDGWNVRNLEAREEGDVDTPYIEVAVNFKNRPPRIVMITSTGRTPLDESMVEALDYADMKTVDLIARAYNWEVNGKTGIKAYLQTMFVTIEEDDLERKYAVIPDHMYGEEPGDD